MRLYIAHMRAGFVHLQGTHTKELAPGLYGDLYVGVMGLQLYVKFTYESMSQVI